MKSLAAAFLALVSLVLVPSLRADTIFATITAGGQTQTLIGTPVLDGEVFTYTHLNTDFFSTSLETFVATYTDVDGLAGVLNVTEVCATVNVFLRQAAPCQNFAFSFTDATLGDISIGTFVGLGANVTGDIAKINFDGSIGAGSGSFDFSKPAPPVPEPGTLSLMATGLIGAAGAIRRKFVKA
jgi:hypothetical protein